MPIVRQRLTKKQRDAVLAIVGRLLKKDHASYEVTVNTLPLGHYEGMDAVCAAARTTTVTISAPGSVRVSQLP